MAVNNLKDLYFSQSALSIFDNCRRRFRYRYLDGLYWPAEWGMNEEVKADLKQGSQFHLLAERYYSLNLGETGLSSNPLLQSWLNRLKKFSTAENLIAKADELFQKDTEESFKESREASNQAVEVLDSIEPPKAENLLPAAYVVRDMPGEEDCFWRISSYDFIYDDPAGWWPIYQANKDKLPEPDNPDLILPGMVMEIPEREGENRHGVWVNGKIKAEAP